MLHPCFTMNHATGVLIQGETEGGKESMYAHRNHWYERCQCE
jgi:hypothetical protein